MADTPAQEIDNAGLEPGCQPHDHVDVAVPAEVPVVLLGALEENPILHFRGPVVCGQHVSNGNMGLLEGSPSLMMAPPGKSTFRYWHLLRLPRGSLSCYLPFPQRPAPKQRPAAGHLPNDAPSDPRPIDACVRQNNHPLVVGRPLMLGTAFPTAGAKSCERAKAYRTANFSQGGPDIGRHRLAWSLAKAKGQWTFRSPFRRGQS